MRLRSFVSLLMIAVGMGLVAYEYTGTSSSPENISVQIIPTPYIMPAVYKVYENPEALDGKYHLFRMILTNKTSKPIRNVDVSYAIPNYIQRTSLKEIPLLLPGQKVVVACYPRFDPGIVSKKSRSRENTEIFIRTSGKERKEGFAFDMRGVNEYYYTGIPSDEQASYSDRVDNMTLLPCYITPNDPVVKYYTSRIQQSVLKGETAAVTGDPKEMVRFLAGIYEATLRTKMVYSSTGGIPEEKGDVSSTVQYLRLPREVITGNTGLCIELSLLYASVLSSAGLEPFIFLIPGHAYPGILANGQFYAIEATGIGGEGLGGSMSGDQALQKGMEELKQFFTAVNNGDERYKIININGLIKKGALAMELKDDDFMKKKIDELFSGMTNASAPSVEKPGPGNSGNTGGSTRSSGRSWRTYQGSLQFNYPAGWRLSSYPMPGYDYFTAALQSPDGDAFVHIYEFPGFGNLNQALRNVQQIASRFGQTIQYQISGSQGVFQVVNGATLVPGGETLQWTGFFRRNGNGISGVILGATASGLEDSRPLLNEIVSSLK